MNTLDGLLLGIVDEPQAEDRWLVLADWLEEHDDPRRGELLRLHRRLLATCLEPDEHPERVGQQARLVELLGQGVQPCVPQRTMSLDDSVELTFAFVPPGSFLMGSPASEPERIHDETRHRVTLTKGYYLGIHQVTQAQWKAIMGGWHYRFKGDALPVETVSWDDCQEFCKNLGQQTGQRFRLPTEAEWEYACRAGTTTPFHFGDTISTDQANYDGDFSYGTGTKGVYRGTTMPVGSFPSNAWGLCDMHGNVMEWCQDWVRDYSEEAQTDPAGVNSGVARVLRNDSWFDAPNFCRSACRGGHAPAFRRYTIGCRVVSCLD